MFLNVFEGFSMVFECVFNGLSRVLNVFDGFSCVFLNCSGVF